MKLNHKIALITGGSRGLGKNTALRLASYGADSIITYNSRKAEADSVVSEIEAKDQRAVALQLDVGDTKSFDGFMQQVSNTLRINGAGTSLISDQQCRYWGAYDHRPDD